MQTLKKNIIYNITYQILVIILPLVTAPYVSRVLGPSALGRYSYTNSIAYYFLLIAMLGISTYGNRSIAASRDDKKEMSKAFWEIYSIQFTSYFLATTFYIIYALFFTSDNKVIFLIQLLYLLSGLVDISWLFFGLEKFKITVIRNTVIKILTVFCVFIFVKSPSDLGVYTFIISVGTLISESYLWIYISKIVSFEKIEIRSLIARIKPILVLFIPVISYSIYKVMGKILLGNLTTYEEVGFFQNSDKIISIPMGIITAIGTVMLPRMTHIVARGERESEKNYIRISLKLVTIVASAIGFGIIGTSNILAVIYFGREYAATAPIMSLLSLTIFAVSWANVMRTQYLIPNNFDRVYVSSTLIGAAINLTANLFLIPMFGANGTAVATILAEFSVMLIQLIFCAKYLPMKHNIFITFPYIINGLVMMIFVLFIGRWLGTSLLTLIIQVLVGGLTYIMLTILYFVISKDEMLYFILKSKTFKKID